MRSFVLVALLVGAVGCSGQSEAKRFYPPEDRARQALDAALSSWKKGAPTGEIAGTAKPTIMLADTHRVPNQRLKEYTVLGLAPGDGPRVFTVKLTFESPDSELKTRFVVIGLDPIWVFRQEDYDMMAQWCAPPAADSAGDNQKNRQ